jgi:hypothetical protein
MSVVDPTIGFVRPTLYDITYAIQADYWANIDPGLDLEPEGPYGQAIALQADREDSLWELLEFLYHSQDPRKAKSFALDAICLYNGIFREPAYAGSVDLTITGTRPVTIPTTFTADDPGNSLSRWVLETEQVLAGVGAFSISATFRCENVGNIPALAGTINNIVTPLQGVDTVTNPLDASPGRLEESDGELRIRRDQSLVSTGGYPADAIRAAVLAVVGVTECKVLENPTGTFDSNGLPPYAIEVIVDGDGYDSAEVASAIWTHRAAGTPLYYTPSSFDFADVVDAEGDTHEVSFTVALVTAIGVNVTVVVDAALYPLDGDTRVKNAIVEAMNPTLFLDTDVIRLKVMSACVDVLGVLDVTVCEMKDANDGLAPYVAANYTIGPRQRARFYTSAIAVTVAP